MSRNKNNLLLIFIVAVGFVLRFWQLGNFPVSLNWDEVSHGYNAYSILKTSRDEWGVFLPSIFRAFGDYKLPVYIYLTVIPVFLFGLNAFAVRFVSALAGAIAIPLIYLLVNELFPKKRPGLLAALLLTISPWHFFISRPALEANLALTLILAGVYFLHKGLTKSKFFILSALFLGLSLHTYNTARVFVPLLLAGFYFIYRPKIKHGPSLVVSLLIMLASLSLVLFQVLSGSGTARYAKLAILSPTAVYQIGQQRLHSRLPSIVARFIYNRPVYFSVTFAKNYLAYFSPTFFNQSKGVQTQFAVPGQNLFTFPVLILAVIGLLYLLKQLADPASKFILVWLIISPVAAATTIDPPQALRPNPMIPVVIILTVYGLFSASTKVRTKLVMATLLLVGLLFTNYLRLYLGDYRENYSASWQYGYRQAISYLTTHRSEYDHVFITKKYGEPHIFYAFFSRLSPEELMPGKDNTRFKLSDWFWTDKIGQVYFVNDWEIPNTSVNDLHLQSGALVSTKNSLLITSPDHLPSNTSKLETIDFQDGNPAFVIARFN